MAEKIGSSEVKTKIVATPFVQVPLGVTEDRLIGTVDIEESIKVGAMKPDCPLNCIGVVLDVY